jgi:putative DeoR family transcriptional regulator (stage III sporulation protein D)
MERKRYEIGNLTEGLEERAILLAQYMIEHKATVRQTAAVFGISKSTVHKDLTEKLPLINYALAAQVREVLDVNKSERHIRGGMATKDKYMREKTLTLQQSAAFHS